MVANIFDEITRRPLQDTTVSSEERESESEPIAETGTEKENQEVIDSARTDKRLRESAQELLRLGLLEESHRPNLYRVAIAHMTALNAILEPLDLAAQADDIRGLIFIRVRKTEAEENIESQDDWSHPLVRKQRLTLEQSLLVAILRQHFVAYEQEAGTGASAAMVAVDELIPQFQLYMGDSGSEARERNRMLQLLDQLKGHGLVSEPDAHERVAIRPMIAHLANPENLQALLQELKVRLAVEDDGAQAEGAE
ncbi:DUF4194 domain-containing protein [Microbulbifer bruguierae]|uniref:DUF4194 domain-containing protein n=1 Tax=Microbulbifer bruguierae TaxID=3029061 RepID=A0ABY8NBM4_9GAMM|nr:DUF4194 domain-containing protein [Microbulbifer bruguierae]WGL15814.1 DUF4194 domain-containing protein [Microbulbifer bruguierae]